jgi:hypothetical protein
VLLAPEQPEKERPAENPGYGPDRQFGLSKSRPCHRVGQHQKSSAQNKRTRQNDPQVLTEKEPHRVGDNQAYKSDRAPD